MKLPKSERPASSTRLAFSCVRRLIGRGGESHSLIGALVEAARRIQAEHGRPAARAWRQWGIA